MGTPLTIRFADNKAQKAREMGVPLSMSQPGFGKAPIATPAVDNRFSPYGAELSSSASPPEAELSSAVLAAASTQLGGINPAFTGDTSAALTALPGNAPMAFTAEQIQQLMAAGGVGGAGLYGTAFQGAPL